MTAAIATSRFFTKLPATWLDALAAAAVPRSFAAGEPIAEQGSRMDALFFVASGEVRLTRGGPDGGPAEPIGEAYRGEVFGVTALGETGVEPLTAVAVSEVTGFAWSREAIAALDAEHPGAKAQLRRRLELWSMEETIVDLLRASDHFRGVAPALLWSTLRLGTAVYYTHDSIVFEEGARSESFYLVVTGEVVVTTEGEHGPVTRARLRSGECFGEVTMLKGGPRNASVVASRDSLLVRFPRHAFHLLWQESPTFQRNIVSLTAERSRAFRERGAEVHVLFNRTHYDVAVLARLLAEELARAFDERTLVVEADGRTTEELRAEIARAAERDDLHHVVCCARSASAEASMIEALSSKLPNSVLLTDDADAPLPIAGVDRIRSVEVRAPSRAARPWSSERQGVARITLERTPAEPRLADLSAASREGVARLARVITRRTVGVALSGGAAWGFAHLALLRAMHAAKLPVDIVAGVSFGSVVGAAYSSLGLEGLDRLEASSGVTMNARAVMAMFSTWAVGDWVRRHLPHARLEHLPIRYLPMAVDILTGRERRFRSGDLAQAVRSSCSLPGAFATTLYEGTRYVDGCVSSNVPVDVLRDEGADVIVASNIIPAPPLLGAEPKRGAVRRALSEASPIARLEATVRSLFLMFNVAGDAQATDAHAVFCPDLTPFNPTNFGNGRAIAAHAATQTAEVIARVDDALRSITNVRMSRLAPLSP